MDIDDKWIRLNSFIENQKPGHGVFSRCAPVLLSQFRPSRRAYSHSRLPQAENAAIPALGGTAAFSVLFIGEAAPKSFQVDIVQNIANAMYGARDALR